MMKLKALLGASLIGASLVVPSISMAETDPAQVATLVRTLGYDAGIHNFKNCILRANSSYRSQIDYCGSADKQFDEAKKIISGMMESADDKQKKALKDIESVINEYQAALNVIKKLHNEKKSAKEIDAALSVNDQPAIDGLKLLRADHDWDMLADLEYMMGYGNAIHQFKNYVLRGEQKYSDSAQQAFKDSIAVLAQIPANGDSRQQAVSDINETIEGYMEAFPIVVKMLVEGKSAEMIDRIVIIDDTPSRKNIAVLQSKEH